jgi:hypothetical protein
MGLKAGTIIIYALQSLYSKSPYISMTKSEKRLDIRLPEDELQILDDYCKATGRTKTDVLRELIRKLARKTQRVSQL